MLDAIFRYFFRRNGWKLVNNVPVEELHRCVITAAPHTTWLDIVYTRAALSLIGVKARITVADKYKVWPIGRPLERLGALWIDRSPRKPGEERRSLVEAMKELFEKHEELSMVVTPEGSRSKRTKWKTGFYHVAKGAGVPIGLGFLDYEKKEAGVGKLIYPSDDMQADLKQMMDFYADIAPLHPDKFSLDMEIMGQIPSTEN